MTTAPDRLVEALADRYRIERELGAGGMATVYLAHDVRHDRRVALKVLRPELAAVIGAERFLSEIKTTANLQHPHILPLFDSGEAGGALFYVMPYVEGETVRDRLTREKQLPVDDALRITAEVASALDYAHRHGVIHRDIKPENILLHDGSALVADFGIALAVSTAGNTRMTETGMSLGTPHYMSPEQAMGEREITARADVYALACVLYEMLTGDPPFTGSTAQAIVARVLTEAPRAMTVQRHTIPPHVEGAVLKALEKLPADRFSTAAEFADALERPALMGATVAAGFRAATVRGGDGRLTLGLVAALLVTGVVAAWGWMGRRGPIEPPTTRQLISLGDSVHLDPQANNSGVQIMALSPDGRTLAFINAQANASIWLKQADALGVRRLPGTDGSNNLTFSPDGKWIAFVANNRLVKEDLANATRVTLAEGLSAGFGGVAWLDDGTLVYVPPNQAELRRVPEAGGANTSAYTPTGTATGGGVGYPVALPHARGVLFQNCGSGCVTQSIWVLDLKTGQAKPLIDNAMTAWYMPNGMVMYVASSGALLAAPFDLKTLTITGPAVPVLDGVWVQPLTGTVQMAFSPTGTLVYFTGGTANAQLSVVRVALDGRYQPVDTAWTGDFNSLAVSPDGRRLAVGVGSSSNLDIWVKQLDRGAFTKLTFGDHDRRPAWSPDGRFVAFIRDTGETGGVFVRAADGTGKDRLAARLQQRVQEVTWSPDGAWLVMRTDNASAGAGDIIGVRTSGDSTPVPLVASPYTELAPSISPDGRWIAYQSLETGRNEVYVRPFPNTDDGHWQISIRGGVEPKWGHDSRSLYFIRADGWLVQAALHTQPAFAVDTLNPLFDVRGFLDNGFHQSYDVSPDGKAFYFTRAASSGSGSAGTNLVWVDHWLTDLNAILKR